MSLSPSVKRKRENNNSSKPNKRGSKRPISKARSRADNNLVTDNVTTQDQSATNPLKSFTDFIQHNPNIVSECDFQELRNTIESLNNQNDLAEAVWLSMQQDHWE